MGRPKGSFKHAPDYRLHKGTGQAVVTLSGKDHYLGKHDSAKSWEKYYRLLAEWKAMGGQIAPTAKPADVLVSEAMASFWVYAQERYRDNPKSLYMYRSAFRPVRSLYGSTKASEFGPKAFKVVRESIMARKNAQGLPLSYNTVNYYMWCVAELFRWAASEEIIPASVHHGIATVPPLQRGKSRARDPEPVGPVHQDDLDATLPLLPAMVRDICHFMLATGARPGEAVIIRPCDIDMSRPVWCYRPHKHKSQYKGYKREVYLGKKAQEIVGRYLSTNLTEYLFKPYRTGRPLDEDDDTRRIGKRRRRIRSMYGKPPRVRGHREHFTREALSTWVFSACKAADALARVKRPETPADVRLVQPWHPHQLRHNAATLITNQFGIETARAVLGHRHTATTDIYAARDGVIAERVMSEVG